MVSAIMKWNTIVLIGLLGFATAGAQDDQLSLDDLLSIKLTTGSFLELDMNRSPLSMTIIDREKVRNSGARHMSELLEIYVPGFQYMYNKWNGIIWGMRGVANDRNTKFIFLVNGHKMNAVARDGAFSEMSLGLLGDIERIEVLRGPAGLVYGSGAIAGIINVVTRKAEKNNIEASAFANTWGNFKQTRRSLEFMYQTVETDSTPEMVVSGGYLASDGIGDGETRIYGKSAWTSPFWLNYAHRSGLPADGSFDATPGNWLLNSTLKWHNLSLNLRATRQVWNAGAMHVYDPWPEILPTTSSFFDSRVSAEKYLDSLIADTSVSNRKFRSIAQYIRTNSYPSAPNRTIVSTNQTVSPNDGYWGSVGWSNDQLNQFVADVAMADLRYTMNMGDNALIWNLGLDANTSRMQRDMRHGYEALYQTEREGYLLEAFGEKRLTLGTMFLWKSLEKLQMASGYEFRYDMIGDDMQGKDLTANNPLRLAVSKVNYKNHALYTEAFYELNEYVGFHSGYRWDITTRTQQWGGTHNGKIAAILTPNSDHTIKLMFQTASNNPTADNWEYNRAHYDGDGNVSTETRFSDPHDSTSRVIIGVTEDSLRAVRPEKTYSWELASTHQFFSDKLTVMPSLSYNIQDGLLGYSPASRVVNSGQYRHVDVDLDLIYNHRLISVGANHSVQRPVQIDPDEEFALTPNRDTHAPGEVTKTIITTLANGKQDTTFKPINNVVDTVRMVRSQVTFDGENFLSLATHTSKLWIDIRPTNWLTLHTDTRIFWGLQGRKDLNDTISQTVDWNFLDTETKPIVKWNASTHFLLPDNFRLSLFVYDILGKVDTQDSFLLRNSIRWQQMADMNQGDLYAVDIRSYAIKIEKEF